MVVAMLRSSSEACPSGSSADSLSGPRTQGFPDAVLAKEAAYNAVGVAAWDLHDYLDLTAWLHASLLPVRVLIATLAYHLGVMARREAL